MKANTPEAKPEYGKVPMKKETMKNEFRSSAMFDNYAEDTLKAANEVGLYKKLKMAWFVWCTSGSELCSTTEAMRIFAKCKSTLRTKSRCCSLKSSMRVIRATSM